MFFPISDFPATIIINMKVNPTTAAPPPMYKSVGSSITCPRWPACPKANSGNIKMKAEN